MKAWVIVADTFDSAHHLPGYAGKCKNVHGHTYKVEFGVNAEIDEEAGMVMDMSLLKDTLRSVLRGLDHYDLNKTIKNPTAENIAREIMKAMLTAMLPGTKCSIRLWETPDASVYLTGIA